jgi:hypothetical protein
MKHGMADDEACGTARPSVLPDISPSRGEIKLAASPALVLRLLRWAKAVVIADLPP